MVTFGFDMLSIPTCISKVSWIQKRFVGEADCSFLSPEVDHMRLTAPDSNGFCARVLLIDPQS